MFKLFPPKVWPPNFDNPPWGDAPSIFKHIALHIDPEKPGLAEGGDRLPDEPEPDPHKISWAAGAFDGVLGHHTSSEPEAQLVDNLYSVLKKATQNGSDKNIKTLYAMFKDNNAFTFCDPLIEKICTKGALDPSRLAVLMHWFATEGADREPVKFAMALLGLLRGNDDSEVFLTLGRHDEFTLYSTVAISDNETYGEDVLFELTKSAEGWGRIHAVERLVATQTPEIKDWLIREGFKNDVMYEYLACICARAGELHLALTPDQIDDELFQSAVIIVETLISGEGGPVEGLAEYEHGCTVITSLLRHGKDRFGTASHYRFLTELKERVDAHLSGERKIEQDWSDDASVEISRNLVQILADEKWSSAILDALENGDKQAFWSAGQVSDKLGIDPWPYFYRRTEGGEDYWWKLMQTSDEKRIDQVLDLAKKHISLLDIATGPSEAMGLGPDYSDHGTLDFILQGIGSFPGKGWEFIRAGLQSPVVRNRNMAIRALSEWGQDAWPDDAMDVVLTAMAAEPADEVKQRFDNLLKGEEIS